MEALGIITALVTPDWGVPLSPEDYRSLEGSWITRELAERAMLRRVDAVQGRAVVGQKGKRDCAGILIPYYWPGEPSPVSYRIRRDNPDWTQAENGKPKANAKYLGAPTSANRLYIPPGVTPEQLANLSIPIVITEGEKKALALWRLAFEGTDTPRFIPIALAGVWNWKGVIGKASSDKGVRVDVKGPIVDLSKIQWERKVLIVFDANVSNNEMVQKARAGIARELAKRHAEVKFVDLPPDSGVNGVDDLLALWGSTKVLELFENPAAAAHVEIVLPSQYDFRSGGMFRVTTKGQKLTEVQLTTYQAKITKNIQVDDGVTTHREFEIEAKLVGRNFQFTISSSEFAGMEWAIEKLGPAAITYPNQRDHARVAVQHFSVTADEHHIYAHTGWRKIDDRWQFLHAAGAINRDGPVTGVNVRLQGALNRYELTVPTSQTELETALLASLRSVELAPPEISFPLRAATCRSILGDADFSLHLVGETGAFKSEIAALEQQHFGATMTRVNLPASWSSTPNALEMLAFHAKDALLVIDDFAPQGSAMEVSRYHAGAERVFRAAGNHSSRSRLDSNANLRDSKPPRGLILSTGEDIPRGHSVRARLLILELSKGAIEPGRLTECQRDAASGLYADAMGGFVCWVAQNFEAVKRTFAASVAELLPGAPKCSHTRTPDIICNLQAAFDLFLRFAVEKGAIEEKDRKWLADRCWSALCAIANSQATHQAAMDSTERFLDLLRAALAGGDAHLASLSGYEPHHSPESCGWRVEGPGRLARQGRCIGWVDGDNLYLESAVAYHVVQSLCRDTSDVVMTEQTLRKRLNEKGLLASVSGKRNSLMIRKSVAGSSKNVLHLRRSTLLPEGVGDGEPDEAPQ